MVSPGAGPLDIRNENWDRAFGDGIDLEEDGLSMIVSSGKSSVEKKDSFFEVVSARKSPAAFKRHQVLGSNGN